MYNPALILMRSIARDPNVSPGLRQALVSGLAESSGGTLPTVPGYYWMRCSPAGDWQVVRVAVAVGEGSREMLPRVMFTGLSQRPSDEEFRRDHPDAEWGDRVDSPAAVKSKSGR